MTDKKSPDYLSMLEDHRKQLKAMLSETEKMIVALIDNPETTPQPENRTLKLVAKVKLTPPKKTK